MKTTLLAIMLISSATIAAAQSDIVLKMKPIDGFGPFLPTSKLLSPYSAEEKTVFKGIPEEIVACSIRKFDIQPYNTTYQYVMNGQVPAEKFESALQSAGIDRRLITGSKYQHSFDILLGSNKQNEYVIIVDENRNLSFSDDKRVTLPIKKNADEEAAITEDQLPVVKCDFEYFDGVKISQVSIPLSMRPYKGHTVITYPDSIDTKYTLTIGIPQYKQQTAVINNKPYTLSVSNSFTSLEYTARNTQLLITAGDTKGESTSKKVTPYAVGDIVTLDSLQYKFERVSLWGDTISLKYLGIDKKAEGFLPGMYLPKVKIQTIQNMDFNFETYRGRYVLMDFWGSWCLPCIQLIPRIAEVNAKYKNRGLVMISVAFDDNIPKLKELIENNKMNWIHLLQSNNNSGFVDRLKVTAFPTLILVDPSGKIVCRDKSIDEIDTILSKNL